MGNSLYISTTEAGSGKALVALGTIDFILRKTAKVSFFRPVIQTVRQENTSGDLVSERDEDIALLLHHFGLQQTYEESFGLRSHEMNDLLGQHNIDRALSIVIEKFKALESRSDFILCEGSDYLGQGSAFEFNIHQGQTCPPAKCHLTVSKAT
jgi:phosphate acetyltransferase